MSVATYIIEIMEKITHEPQDEDAWICLCGNTPSDDGFYPCDDTGQEIEPVLGSGWDELYVCGRCKRLIRQSTLAVVAPSGLPLGG